MSKLRLISIIFSLLIAQHSLLSPAFAAVPRAAPPSDVLNPTGITSPVTEANQFWNILKLVLQWTYTIFFIVAVIFILFAAYNFLFARGNPEKIKEARTQIMWAAIAIAVALISVGAAQIVSSFIGGRSTTSSNYTDTSNDYLLGPGP